MYEALVNQMQHLGVDSMFSVPASETLALLAEAAQRGIRHFSARHEQAAVSMADGYSRIVDKGWRRDPWPGPSLTNGANAMITAAKAGSAVLIIGGALPPSNLDDLHGDRRSGRYRDYEVRHAAMNHPRRIEWCP